MNIRNEAPRSARWAWGHIRKGFAFLPLLSLLSLSPNVWAQSAEAGKVYCLAETQLPDGTIFFWDKTDPRGLAFDVVDYNEVVNHRKRDWLDFNSPTIIRSNAAVIVFPNRQDRRDSITPNVVWGDGVESAIPTWVDARGFVHSADVLRRQMADIGLRKFNGYRSLTGILDRETLWSASEIMNSQLKSAQQDLLQVCKDAVGEQTPCDAPPWPNAQIRLAEDAAQRAGAALSRYDRELLNVQFAPPAARPDACDLAPRLFYSPPPGESIIDQFKVDFYAANDPNNRDTSYFGGGPDPIIYPHEVQDGVTEAVDPSSFDSEMAQKLAQLEAEARKRIAEVMPLVDIAVSMNSK